MKIIWYNKHLIKTTQIPRISNNFCYICKFKYLNYKEVICNYKPAL